MMRDSVYDLYRMINELMDLLEAEEKTGWYEDEKQRLVSDAKFEANYILEELDKMC